MSVPAFEYFPSGLDLLPSEQERLNQLIALAQKPKTDSKHIAAIIIGALVLRHLIVVRRVKQDGFEDTITSKGLVSRFQRALGIFQNDFSAILVPMFAAVIARDVKRAIPASQVNQLAQDYADRLGDYFDRTSLGAMEAGFNSLVNRRVLPGLAAEKASEAFGLTQRQMNAYVNTNFEEKKPFTSFKFRSPKMAASRFIIKSLEDRLRKMGTHEAFTLTQEAQQIRWLWDLKVGNLPEGTQKIWVTAHDERVCKICGPMNGAAVDVTEKFELPNGEFASITGVHPLCRCRLKLSEAPRLALVSKGLNAMALREFNVEHPRDEDGQFTHKIKPKLSVVQAEHFLDQLREVVPDSPFAPPTHQSAFSGGKPFKAVPKPAPQIKAEPKVEPSAFKQETPFNIAPITNESPFMKDATFEQLKFANESHFKHVTQGVEEIQADVAAKKEASLFPNTLIGMIGASFIERDTFGNPKFISLRYSDRNADGYAFEKDMSDEEIAIEIALKEKRVMEQLEKKYDMSEIMVDVDGIPRRVIVTGTTIQQVVEAAARNYPNEEQIEVVPKPEEGRYSYSFDEAREDAVLDISLEELGNAMNISPEDFQHDFYRLNTESRPEDEISGGSTYGHGRWNINHTEFDVEWGERKITKSGYQINYWDLYPRD